MSDRENAVWNRAAFGSGADLAEGDSALAGLLRLHSRAMSGGVLDALESTTGDAFADAVHGYRYFGLVAAAEVLEDVRSRLDQGLSGDEADAVEAAADQRYGAVIVDDDVIFSAFRARLRADRKTSRQVRNAELPLGVGRRLLGSELATSRFGVWVTPGSAICRARTGRRTDVMKKRSALSRDGPLWCGRRRWLPRSFSVSISRTKRSASALRVNVLECARPSGSR